MYLSWSVSFSNDSGVLKPGKTEADRRGARGGGLVTDFTTGGLQL